MEIIRLQQVLSPRFIVMMMLVFTVVPGPTLSTLCGTVK